MHGSIEDFVFLESTPDLSAVYLVRYLQCGTIVDATIQCSRDTSL